MTSGILAAFYRAFYRLFYRDFLRDFLGFCAQEGTIMKPKTRSPDVRTLIKRIPAEARDIPEVVIAHLRPLARVVAIWRQDDGRPGRWVYLERMYVQEFSVDEVIQRYGGGDYRGKILGKWDPERRCEAYLTQVTFSIDPYYPPTAATLAKMRPL